jgi:hypothetical protein
MQVQCIQCPKCLDILYSRARHDFRMCSCDSVYIDGGFEYMRYGGDVEPIRLQKRIKADKFQLFDDWDNGQDEFGLIKTEKNK